MIVGLGSDLIDIRRIERSLDRYGQRFTQRIFTETERIKSEGRKHRAAFEFSRLAAPQACAKALGTGIAQGVFWTEMGVVNLDSGRPTMELTGGAAARLHAILPPGYEACIHLTITDDHPLAQAFVIIEAVRAEQAP